MASSDNEVLTLSLFAELVLAYKSESSKGIAAVLLLGSSSMLLLFTAVVSAGFGHASASTASLFVLRN